CGLLWRRQRADERCHINARFPVFAGRTHGCPVTGDDEAEMATAITESTKSEGILNRSTVTCPSHGSQFDVYTGAAMSGLAENPFATYRVTVEDETQRVDVPLSQSVQGA